MAINSKQYWAARLDAEQQLLYDASTADLEKLLAEALQEAYTDVVQEIAAFYDRLQAKAKGGKILVSDLYKYDRYYKLQGLIQDKLKDIGKQEIRLISQHLLDFGRENSQMIANNINSTFNKGWVGLNDSAIRKMVNTVWCSDGNNFSSRIWNNKAILLENLNQGLMVNITTGRSRSTLVNTLMDACQVEHYKASRIVRTETNFIQNQSALQTYLNNGCQEYEFYAAIDSRTSKICRSLHKKIFPIDAGKAGTNMPPMHPNCRSTIIPVLNID